MEKKKTVKTFQRRTKSGKTVTVRQHESKYSAADAKNEELKKRTGAGSELAKKKLGKWGDPHYDLQDKFNDIEESDTPSSRKSLLPSGKEHLALRKKVIEHLVSKHGENSGKLSHKQLLDTYTKMKGEFSKKMPQKDTAEKKTSSKKVTTPPDLKSIKNPNWKKSSTATDRQKLYSESSKTAKTATPSHGVSAEEYKSWYHWDMQADPKNKLALSAQKKMKAHMGASAYKKHFNDASESYSARGHNKAYNSISAPADSPSKGAPVKKEPYTGAKIGSKEHNFYADQHAKKMTAKERKLTPGKTITPPKGETYKDKPGKSVAIGSDLQALKSYKPIGNAYADKKFFDKADKFILGKSTVAEKYEALKLMDRAMGSKPRKEDPKKAIHSYLIDNGVSEKRAATLSGLSEKK